MVKVFQILIRTFALATSAAALLGCGQRGPLYLPAAPEATQRATLPETLSPLETAPAAPASAPR
ncbi:LPS translocon maturation chaperone LptM [Acidovorax soli]|uniref:LPS translocon maturation chaperone LptM n=1 Tax=Acidovorax soli TaxID=592050 RepID=UPI0032B24D5B